MTNHLSPGPKGKPLLGSLLSFYGDILGFLTRVVRDYGDIAYFELGPRKVFFLNHPDLIKDVLVTHHRNFLKSRALERSKLVLGNGLLTSEGEFHLRNSLISPLGADRGVVSANPLLGWRESLIIATLASRWKTRLVPGHPVKPKPLITLHPKCGIRMPLERR